MIKMGFTLNEILVSMIGSNETIRTYPERIGTSVDKPVVFHELCYCVLGKREYFFWAH